MVLTPLVSELALGSTPVRMAWLVLLWMPVYGAGVLLIRELVTRSGRGWPSILLLALAYEVVEDGIGLQALTSPHLYHAAAWGAVAALLLAFGVSYGAGSADAYTRHGDVLVTVAVSGDGCATVTWPKGTTSTECDVYQITHDDIVPGDTFGASITSYSGYAVACSVVDLVTGDTIARDTAGPGYTADCIRTAN